MPTGQITVQASQKQQERKIVSMLAQGLPQADIMRAVQCSQAKVSRVAKTWEPLLSYLSDLKEYRSSRLDLIDAAQAKVLSFALNEAKLNKANLYSLAYLLRQLYDISRLEQGKAVDIQEKRVAVVHLDKYYTNE